MLWNTRIIRANYVGHLVSVQHTVMIHGVGQMQTADHQAFLVYIVFLISVMRANHQQANRSAIWDNRNIFRANRSAIQPNRSSIPQPALVAHRMVHCSVLGAFIILGAQGRAVIGDKTLIHNGCYYFFGIKSESKKRKRDLFKES